MRAQEFILEQHLKELAYEGNIGMQEMFKFHQLATPEQKEELKELLGKKLMKAAWKLVQDVIGYKLTGDEFGGSVTENTLTEIGYCDETQNLSIPEEEIVFWSKKVGFVENEDVWLFEKGSKLYFFKDDAKITAFVLLSGNNIKGIRNISGRKGQITALVMYLTRTENKVLVIHNDEMLSSDGFKWLQSLLYDGGRGLTITDQNKKQININDLSKEWIQSKNREVEFGPTSIIIEDKTKIPLRGPEHFNKLINNRLYFGSKVLL